MVLALLVATGLGLGLRPGPETYEAKWLLPGLDGPPADAESSHSYDVRFYRIDLDLPMTSGAMTAHAGIWLKSEEPALDSVVFDFVDLECDSVKHADSLLDFDEASQFLTVRFDAPLAQGDSVYVEVYYHRTAGLRNQGFYWYEQDLERDRLHAVCYSITEPEDSRYWFPCWDSPWDKAEQGCQVSIKVPDSVTACANGLLDSTTTGTDDTRTFWWTHRYPIPSYLVNFAASIFSRWRDWAYFSPTESLPIDYYVWPEDSSAGIVAFYTTPDMVEFYSLPDRFGMYPFPEEKYGMVAVYPFGFGGMEHQTMTTIHRWWVMSADESGIAHELAHMWFGDAVTCLDWREIWLNEGSASYLDPLWFHHHYGRQSFLDAMEYYRQGYFEADTELRRPLYDPPMQELFDWGHTYCKAAWVNHMTRYVEGDTVFDSPGTWFATERAWVDSFRYGNATTEDRKRLHERASGLELDWFYDEWVFQAGYPDYTVNWYGRETVDGWEVVIDVAQDNGAQAPAVFHMPVEVLVHTWAGDTLLHYDIAASPQRNTFAMPDEPTGIVFDPGAWLLKDHRITSGIENRIDPFVGVARPVLHAVAPNPSPGPARVRFSLPNARDVRLAAFDATGRAVAVLSEGRFDAGHHDLAWDPAGLASGVYLLRLEAGPDVSTQKVVVGQRGR